MRNFRWICVYCVYISLVPFRLISLCCYLDGAINCRMMWARPLRGRHLNRMLYCECVHGKPAWASNQIVRRQAPSICINVLYR